ncbi:HAD family hydrolase [Streptomyces albus]|uniref:HAD family hydrolase n=1 Tax=Streptomyces sp. NRRL F-5639 TaxID=1463867 RepID=UPI0004C9C6D6|nr:HAD family phosphatase [Streptomyces sp. NRRL F-5639]
MPHRYRALLLDFAGVLTVGIRAAHESWCVAQGLAPDAWEATLGRHPDGRRYYRALEIGAMTQREWNRRTAALMGLADHDNLMGRAWSAVRPAEDVIGLARDARAAGLRIALLSNSFGLDPYDPYAHCGVWDLADVHVISERERVAKPDPAIYRLALDRLGVPAHECLFVDDNPVNLPPARALGITAVHATTQRETVARLSTALGLTDTGDRMSL